MLMVRYRDCAEPGARASVIEFFFRLIKISAINIIFLNHLRHVRIIVA